MFGGTTCCAAAQPARRYSAFDIAEDSAPDGRLILRVLAQPYGDELLAGRLTLQSHGDGLVVAYDRHRFPISTDTEQRLLASGRPNVGTDADEDATAIALAISADVSRLHELLEAQHYRLAWWRLARDEAPYRRFFDVNGLIGVRVEDLCRLGVTHELVLAWVEDGSIDGLRVDHVDGLADPAAYLTRLAQAAPHLPIFVEKIPGAGRALAGVARRWHDRVRVRRGGDPCSHAGRSRGCGDRVLPSGVHRRHGVL